MFHVYDRYHLSRMPRRYTVGAGHELGAAWDTSADAGRYDRWIWGPNGFHRHFTGELAARAARLEAPPSVEPQPVAQQPEIRVEYDRRGAGLRLSLQNGGGGPITFLLVANAYAPSSQPQSFRVAAGATCEHFLSVRSSASWYDFTVRVEGLDAYSRRFAGRVETGRHSLSDLELGGRARAQQGC